MFSLFLQNGCVCLGTEGAIVTPWSSVQQHLHYNMPKRELLSRNDVQDPLMLIWAITGLQE